MNPLFDRFTHSQQSLSRSFDRLLPADYQVGGNLDFVQNWIAPYLRAGALVYDIGGGKNPIISVADKRRLGLSVIGLDIDSGQLAAAPADAYDRQICADVTQFHGSAEADLVICQALLEHVKDSPAAI